MIIDKVLNNNVVISLNEKGQETVVMGTGLGFQMKPGMHIVTDKIEKIFGLELTNDNSIDERYYNLLKDIPIQLLVATEEIVELAQKELSGDLHPSVRISLADHLYFAIARCAKGNTIKNAILWEIKKLYKNEFEVGLKALDIIKKFAGITLPEDEAGFIALHIVNAQLSEDMSNTIVITNLIKEIVQMIKYDVCSSIDEDSVSYQRLVTHLKFFGHRLLSNSTEYSEDDSLYNAVRASYPQSFSCTQKIYLYIESKFEHAMTQEEMMFLTIHIERVRRSFEE